jgi:hypothetical protein
MGDDLIASMRNGKGQSFTRAAACMALKLGTGLELANLWEWSACNKRRATSQTQKLVRLVVDVVV